MKIHDSKQFIKKLKRLLIQLSHLNTSCQIEAQRNWSINNLRSDLRALLEEMGNTIIPAGDGSDDGAARWIKAAGDALDWEHCNKVANAKDIDRRTYNSRQNQDYLKPEEVLECEKFRIQDTYGTTVSPELVEKDDGGRLIKKIIALEGLLAQPGEIFTDDLGREFVTPPDVVAQRDKSERERLAICTDWGNYSTSWLDRLSSNLPSTPPINKDGSNNWGGMDGQQNLSNQWWDRVKYYAQLAIERVKQGIDSVK
jgi:hypothetical protein